MVFVNGMVKEVRSVNVLVFEVVQGRTWCW